MSAYLKLARRHQKFVDAIVRGLSGVAAARQIASKSRRPDVIASKLRARQEIKDAIEERRAEAIEDAGIETARLLTELAHIAFFDVRKLFDEHGNLRPVHELDEAVASAIASIEVDELYAGKGEERITIGRTKRVRTSSKVEALKLLGQYKKLFAERHELSGLDGKGLVVQLVKYADDPTTAPLLTQTVPASGTQSTR